MHGFLEERLARQAGNKHGFIRRGAMCKKTWDLYLFFYFLFFKIVDETQKWCDECRRKWKVARLCNIQHYEYTNTKVE